MTTSVALQAGKAFRSCSIIVKKYDYPNFLASILIKDKQSQRAVFAVHAFNNAIASVLRPIHTSPTPAPSNWWLREIPNHIDFDFASKKCASTVIMPVLYIMPIHWHNIYLALFSHRFAAGSGGAKRENVEIALCTTRNAIALCITASRCLFTCLFALPLQVWIGLWKI